MKLVFQHENRGIVYSMKNILEMHGIDAHVKNDYSNPMGAEFGINNTLLELWVFKDEDYEEAAAIIARQANEPAEPDRTWICRQCGEENAGNFSVCWNCQHPRSDTA